MSSSLTAPLKDLLTKCDVIFQLAEKDHLDPAHILHQQPFAHAGAVQNIHVQTVFINPWYAYTARVAVVVCVSGKSHLTSGASVRPENTVT